MVFMMRIEKGLRLNVRVEIGQFYEEMGMFCAVLVCRG